MQPSLAATEKRKQLPRLSSEGQAAPGARGVGRASHAEAIAKLLADAEATGEGTRIVSLAATRKGKTAFNRKLVTAFLARGVAERVLVHDQKFPHRAQYSGGTVSNVVDMRAGIATFPVTVAVQAYPPITGEDVAALTREATDAGIKTLAVFDEGDFCLKTNDEGEPIERVWQGPNLAWLQLQGGAAGASTLCTFQMLRKAPSSCTDSASAFVIGNLGGRSLSYARDFRILPAEALDVVTCLAPGEVCLFFADREWDWTIYYSPES
jgi:hypothetical protein